MHYVYILRLENGQFYVGYTTNIDDRLARHKRGEACRTTERISVETVEFYAAFRREDRARTFEKYLKSSSGFAFSPSKTTEFSVDEKDFSVDTVREFKKKNTKALSQPGNHLGLWKSNGRMYLDVSQVGDASAATLGKAQNSHQLAVFDLETFTEIPTGTIENEVYTPLDEATRLFDKHRRQVRGSDRAGGDGSETEVRPNDGGGRTGSKATATELERAAQGLQEVNARSLLSYAIQQSYSCTLCCPVRSLRTAHLWRHFEERLRHAR
ncbi:hypothetical protein EXS70_03190 [Candidatus Peribacteria bacterium]|nr:hypothetical protein [Candidatus Peribacteria bacterium]